MWPKKILVLHVLKTMNLNIHKHVYYKLIYKNENNL